MAIPIGFDEKAYEESVLSERVRQLQKFGIQRHIDVIWLTILLEEIGEVAQAALDDLFAKGQGNLETEIIQCIAVLESWLESRNENKDSWQYRQNLLKALTENKLTFKTRKE